MQKNLAVQKWENDYGYGNCGHDSYHNGKQAGTRICSKRKCFESETVPTLFNKDKFNVKLILINCIKKGLTAMSYQAS